MSYILIHFYCFDVRVCQFGVIINEVTYIGADLKNGQSSGISYLLMQYLCSLLQGTQMFFAVGDINSVYTKLQLSKNHLIALKM